jgi:hypothetical protein
LPVTIFDDAHHLPTKTRLELPMVLDVEMDSLDPMLVILSVHEQLGARLRNPLLRLKKILVHLARGTRSRRSASWSASRTAVGATLVIRFW